MNFKKLIKSKTFWAGVTAVIGAGAACAQGAMTPEQATQLAATGLVSIFLRDAVSKIEKNISAASGQTNESEVR